jgi:hypothetical protein
MANTRSANTSSMKTRRGAALLTVIAVCLATTACADDDEPSAASSVPSSVDQVDPAELFPVTVDAALEGLDLAGNYSIEWAEAYCDTFASCGTLPAAGTVTIAVTPEQWLEVDVPGMFTVALFAVQGSLYGITDTDTILPPCGETPQVARVAMTLYADAVTVAADGTRTVDRLGAAVTVDGSNSAECAGGLAFYGAELTPS